MEAAKTHLRRVLAGRLKSRYIKDLAILPGRCWEMTLLFKDGLSPRTFEYAKIQTAVEHGIKHGYSLELFWFILQRNQFRFKVKSREKAEQMLR